MENTENGRRDFIKTAGKAGLALGLAQTILPAFAADDRSKFNIGFLQRPLPYDFSALEPHIDAMTMEIHYTKHAATYAKNLAEATAAEKVDTAKMKLEDVLKNISKYSSKMRNNAGGHYNHEMFWEIMSPKADHKTAGRLNDAIVRDFGSMDALKNQFNDAAKSRFGSGWAWLVMTTDKKLVVTSTPNQDNPLMDVAEVKGFPLIGLDVWEHAYYLKYQNKRPDYINAWWNVLDLDQIEKRYRHIA